jgi:hypothetical protein
MGFINSSYCNIVCLTAGRLIVPPNQKASADIGRSRLILLLEGHHHDQFAYALYLARIADAGGRG